MNAEERQALIDFNNSAIIGFEARQIYAELSRVEEMQLESLRIALAALTAKPVKLMDCDFGAVSHMSGGSEDYCNGFVDGTQNAIKAIRAAGYQVQGE